MPGPEKHPKPTFKVERISPDVARQYLEANSHNRPLSGAVVKNYTAEMRAGEWMMNAEAIKFDWNGRLVDGQHRLRALIRAGTTLEFLVARNLDPECFKSIDTGRARNAADIVGLRGIKYHAAVASAYRQLWRYLNRDKSKRRISNMQLLEFMDEHPRLGELATVALNKPYYVGKVLSQAAHVLVFYIVCVIDEPRGQIFFQCLARDRADAPSQVAYLRRRLTQLDSEALKPTAAVKLAMLIETWNHYLASRKLERLPRMYSHMPRFVPEPRFQRRISGA